MNKETDVLDKIVNEIKAEYKKYSQVDLLTDKRLGSLIAFHDCLKTINKHRGKIWNENYVEYCDVKAQVYNRKQMKYYSW